MDMMRSDKSYKDDHAAENTQQSARIMRFEADSCRTVVKSAN